MSQRAAVPPACHRRSRAVFVAVATVCAAVWTSGFANSVAPDGQAAVPAVHAVHAAPGADVPPIRYGVHPVPPRTDGAIRLAAYNVLNLFDDVDDPTLQGRFDDAELTTSDQRCRNLAAMIRALDADVLALQEVESEDALRWFRDTYLADLGYEHLASEDVGYFRGVECSLLSRFPIREVTVWPNQSLAGVDRAGPGWTPVPDDAPDPPTYQRSPLRAQIELPTGQSLVVYVLHHKSGRSYGWLREAEALRTIEKVRADQAQDREQAIAVLGDFNAAPWDKAFRLYLEAGLVDPHAHRAMPRSSDADPQEANRFKTHESGRVIDYVLLNAAAFTHFVPGTAGVVGAPYDPEYDWREDPHPAWYASDHYPVFVELSFGDDAGPTTSAPPVR